MPIKFVPAKGPSGCIPAAVACSRTEVGLSAGSCSRHPPGYEALSSQKLLHVYKLGRWVGGWVGGWDGQEMSDILFFFSVLGLVGDAEWLGDRESPPNEHLEFQTHGTTSVPSLPAFRAS